MVSGASSWIIFQKEQKNYFKNTFPDMKHKQVNEILASMWKEMPADLKQPYSDASLAHRQARCEAMSKSDA
jgi:hypothetical protein